MLLFGVAASFMALRSVIYVEIMGIENLTRTFGMITMMLGIGIFIGTPALGSFKNIFGTYTYTFVAAGALFIASGFLHGSLPWVKKWEESKVKIVKM